MASKFSSAKPRGLITPWQVWQLAPCVCISTRSRVRELRVQVGLQRREGLRGRLEVQAQHAARQEHAPVDRRTLGGVGVRAQQDTGASARRRGARGRAALSGSRRPRHPPRRSPARRSLRYTPSPSRSLRKSAPGESRTSRTPRSSEVRKSAIARASKPSNLPLALVRSSWRSRFSQWSMKPASLAVARGWAARRLALASTLPARLEVAVPWRRRGVARSGIESQSAYDRREATE